MKAEIFTLCDAATEQQGKMNLLGSFDHLWAREEPITHPSCTLAMKLRFDRFMEGVHQIRITFGDEDGKLVMPPLEAKVNVVLPRGESTAVTHLILNIQQLKLPKFGEYAIDLTVDDKVVSSQPLYVRQAPQRPGSAG